MDICLPKVTLAILSIDKVEKTESIKIYPNPAGETLYVDVFDNSATNITMYNIVGSQLMTKVLNQNERRFEIDLSEMPEGVYTVLVTGEDFVYSEKVLVVR